MRSWCKPLDHLQPSLRSRYKSVDRLQSSCVRGAKQLTTRGTKELTTYSHYYTSCKHVPTKQPVRDVLPIPVAQHVCTTSANSTACPIRTMISMLPAQLRHTPVFTTSVNCTSNVQFDHPVAWRPYYHQNRFQHHTCTGILVASTELPEQWYYHPAQGQAQHQPS